METEWQTKGRQVGVARVPLGRAQRGREGGRQGCVQPPKPGPVKSPARGCKRTLPLSGVGWEAYQVTPLYYWNK